MGWWVKVDGSGGVSGAFGSRGDMLFCEGVDVLDWDELDRQGGIEGMASENVYGVGWVVCDGRGRLCAVFVDSRS
jgi:hypothetical protein